MTYRIFVFILLITVCGNRAYAKNYYFSNTGNDAASGVAAQSAWRSLDRLSGVKLNPGDTLFFQRGHQFNGSIRINQSGLPDKPIVLTAYGQGPDPVIKGSVSLNNWKAIGNNKFETKSKDPVWDIFAKGKRYTPSRYPNQGFLTIEKGFGKDSIQVKELQQPDGYWNGATLRIRPLDWVYETRTVGDYSNGLIIQARQNRYPIEKSFEERTQKGKTGIYKFEKGYGFFLEGLPHMIDSAYEWSWEKGKLLVQMPEGKTPDTEKLEAVVHHYGVWLKENTKHIVIHGLSFQHFEKAGVGGAWHLADIQVHKNQFRQIHGTGVFLDSASQNCKVISNQFSDILGRGISALEAVGMEIADNELKRIGLERTHGWSGVNGATGIVIHNVERPVQTDTTFAHHNIVRNNRVDSCGYNGIRVDGSYNLIEYNVVGHCSLTLNDGANIYTYGKGPSVSHHSVIRNNIVRYSVGDSEATPGNPNLAFGIYLDNNSNNMLVEGNTVIATGASGIVNNDASYNNTIRKNLIYDCKEGIGFAEWANVGKIYGLVVEENIVVGLTLAQKAVGLINWLAPTLELGRMSNNQYINITATPIFNYATRQIPEATRLQLSFDQWKQITNNDKESTAITAATAWSKGKAPKLLVNDSPEKKVFDLGKASYWMIDGSKAAATIELAPFKSMVVFEEKN